MPNIAKNQCRFCGSRSCYIRIYTKDYTFDELACRDHTRDLEIFSDAKLGKTLRMHTSSSGKLSRGVHDYDVVEAEIGRVSAGSG